MSKALPFTERSLRRAIRAALKAGLRVTGIRPDGTLLVEVAPAERTSHTELPLPDTADWGHVEA